MFTQNPVVEFIQWWCSSGGSDGKKSACDVEDSGSTPGLGRSPGEGLGASLVAQMIKKMPAMQEIWV